MENTSTRNFLHELLSIDMAAYLEKIGLETASESIGITGYVTFHSPFYASEEGPAALLFADTSNNTWFCPSSGTSGNFLDFGTKFHRCSIPAFMERIHGQYEFKRQIKLHPQYVPEEHYGFYKSIGASGAINNKKLLRLLQANGLPLELVNRYCAQQTVSKQGTEVEFQLLVLKSEASPQHYLAFDLDSYNPIANRFSEFANSCSYSFIDNGSDKLEVYSSIMDMLHSRHMYTRDHSKGSNILVLSDVFAFEKARQIMEQHGQVNLYLQNDRYSGQYKGYASWLSQAYKDFSNIYKDHQSLTAYRNASAKLKNNNKSLRP